MKSLKRKILTSFIMIMIIMSTLVSYKVFAKALPEKNIEYEPYSEMVEISQDDLISKPEILCTEKGTYLPKKEDKTMASEVDGNGKPIGNKINTAVLGDNEATYNTLWGKHYKTKEKMYYATFTTVTCTPKSAYILNYINENNGGYPSKVQTAWWAVKPDGKGITVKDNDLSKEAKAYQDFVKKIAKNKSDVNNPEKYKTLKHTTEDKKEVKIKFPEVEPKTSFAFDSSKMKVNFDNKEQKYRIGPLTLKYAEGNYGDVDFGYIDSFDIYTDASTEPLNEKQWKFEFTDKHDSTKNYPDGSGKDEFYIIMDFIPNATKITGINVDYKYLVVGGKYQTLSGTYEEYEWTCKRTLVEEKDQSGNVINRSYQYKLKAKDQELHRKSQTLALANNAARWYESEKISIGRPLHKGKLIIQKVAYDENGNIMTEKEIKEKFGKDQNFDFEVKIKYADGHEEPYTVEVKGGTSEIVGEFYWDDKENAPTYEVREIKPSDDVWTFVSIDDDNKGTIDGNTITGSLRDNGNVIVIAFNKCNKPKNDEIGIIKEISESSERDKIFDFKVGVTMPNGEKDIRYARIFIPKGAVTCEKWKISNTQEGLDSAQWQQGDKWLSGKYEWYGKDYLDYEIIELPTDDNKEYTVVIDQPNGKLKGDGKLVNVSVINGKDIVTSSLTIKKQLIEGQTTEDTFDFKVTVSNAKQAKTGEKEIEVTGLKAGETRQLNFVWEDPNTQPDYIVEEEKRDSFEVSNIEETVLGQSRVEKNTNKITGKLVKYDSSDESTITNIVETKFTNNMTPHQGNIKVVKKFTSQEKMTDEELKKEIAKLDKKVTFDVKVIIDGAFKYEENGEEKTHESSEPSKVINKTLSKDNNWQFEINNIKWWGDNVPTFRVIELRSPEVDWPCEGINYSYLENRSTDTEGHELKDSDTVNVTITNRIPADTEKDLTFKMAGIVWVDKMLDSKNNEDNGYYSKPNGVYDDGEMLKAGTEVWVYKIIYDRNGKVVSRTPAKAYKDAQNNEMTFPIITLDDGAWDVPRIPIPGLSKEEIDAGYTADYDVEFVYDGQTYEPTEFLSYKVSKDEKEKIEGSDYDRAKDYRNATKSQKKKYERDSMAIENLDTNTSKKIAKVSGKTEINANGDTTGIATLTDGTQLEIEYSSDDVGTGYPVHSKLKTTDNNGNLLDIFKTSATTSAGQLTFPFNVKDYDGSSLSSADCKFTLQGFKSKYKYSAVYNYCLHINLGLKERADADIGLTKNLENAKVIVNEKMFQYNYGNAYDFTEEHTDALQQDIYVQNASSQTDYNLGLYKSDYYYRTEMYSNNQELYNALKDLDTELDVYLTYKIKVRNSSSSYKVKIDSIDDYYEKSLELVRNPVNKYLKTQTIGGSQSDVNDFVTIANSSEYNWNIVKEGIVGSDNVTYNKMNASGLNIELLPGESKDIYLTYRVSKSKDNKYGIDDSVILGQKCNVAEIASYSTYDLAGNNAGKIDRDSAPANINLSSYNEKAWYEDDTFAAPRININLLDNFDRTIDGVVWEDDSNKKNTENPKYNQTVGNGQIDSGEASIPGLKTELWEKVAVKVGDNQYQEYEYLCPTDTPLECLNGNKLKDVCGLNTTTETDNEGKYVFQNAIAGDYVVRFVYGDKKIDSKTNYSTSKAYNGQDFKSTKFNADLKSGTTLFNADLKTLQADSYLNTDVINDYTEEKNTAIDNEVRRLQVVKNSREITYTNSSEMANYDGNELYEKYWMYSETPKIDINIEPSSYNGQNSNATGYTYEVKHINFGLEERPITQLTLDKQIEEIILTTSDGNNIMDAKYNIEYKVDEECKITADVKLDTKKSYGIDNLQSLNRDEATNQGFRYISVDPSILEGTTITVKYKFTVLNTGEVDRTGKLAEINYIEDTKQIDSECDKLTDKLKIFTKKENSLTNETPFGYYVGNIYYYGSNCDVDKDAVVTSRVRQLVDYIDNDVEFSGRLNASENMSWSSVTVDELKPFIDGSILSENKILDEDGVSYENNTVINIDNRTDGESIKTESSLNNGNFIVNLQPYEVNHENYQASMYLTTTKYLGSDSDDLQIDNIAEIIKYNNKVGRRDELTIIGNQNPAEALLEPNKPIVEEITVSLGMAYGERDTSATEKITLSPPFGSSLMIRRLQIVASIGVGLIIIAGGIVIIKKKVLK